ISFEAERCFSSPWLRPSMRPKAFDASEYAKENFSMYGGELKQVTMQFSNDLIGVVIDRFGKELPIRKKGSRHFETMVCVAVSPQFYAWVFGLGLDAEITAPSEVRKEMRRMLNETHARYIAHRQKAAKNDI
ncbi:MAG: WYL domain-containing protein, partial [Oscillospiraceae bacterium]|nr:WYL domain-containing protein [Oscillospiraceae bacterium]